METRPATFHEQVVGSQEAGNQEADNHEEGNQEVGSQKVVLLGNQEVVLLGKLEEGNQEDNLVVAFHVGSLEAYHVANIVVRILEAGILAGVQVVVQASELSQHHWICCAAAVSCACVCGGDSDFDPDASDTYP